MASTLDKYEKDTLRSIMINSFKSSFNDQALFNDEDDPIFNKEFVEKIRLSTGAVTHLAVANNHIALIQGNRLLRYDLHPFKEYKDIELNRIVPGVSIIGLFLDPTADFLMVSFSTELLLFYKKSPKHKSSNRFKGQEITSVAWHPFVSLLDSTSRPVLIGTNGGYLFEAEFNRGEKYFNSNPEVHVKELFRIGESLLPITSLEYHFLPNNRLVVFATTVDRLYHFVESRPGVGDRPNLINLFTSYLTSPESFQSMPCGKNFGGFHVFRKDSKGTDDSSPKALGWLTLTGIFYCQIDPSKEENLLTKTTVISLPANLQPKSFIFTDFHFLLLCDDCVFSISMLSKEMVSCDYFNEEYGKLISITKDPVTSMVWIAAERGIFLYKISREDRDVWKIYTEMGNYELAVKFATSNPISLNQVKICQAVSLFIDKKYEDAAVKFSETQCPVELVALKFLQANQTQALKIYLKKEFMSLGPENKTQQTMMVIWILDLILEQLAKKRVDAKSDLNKRDSISNLQCELESFLSIPQVSECVISHKKVIYDLMASHGDQLNIIKLAKVTKDYDKIIKYYINKGDYLSALDTLKELPYGIERVANLWYTYAPIMIEVLPKQTLSAIKELNPSLDPVKLLPALIAAETQQVGELIKYLEFCIRSLNSTHQPLHNLLLSLYAKHQPDKLLKYIALQGEDPGMVNYDMRYAVRICKRFGHKQACVQLFALLGLWEAAMDLALTISVELAVQTASHIHCSPNLSRTLWLKIAKHVVEEKNDIEQAMKFLQQCELIKIEDILPFFSDFVTIDHFKDAICSSLQEYNQHIQDLKEEMEDASKSSQLIRNEINEFRSRHTIISTADKCTICDGQLMSQSFFVFPCSHMFHSDCLSSQYASYLPGFSEVEGNEMDLSSQCLYCGDLMIDLINKPFINEEEYERIKKEWM